ncbi:flagellar hook capping FlgD N-terminal domain-containing protein [Sulfurimonas microaerophilic]|uniref:flagellar hook capping FlgD N-terminal domain-containing protein n=1 Tax=Sulfurimonas microaerophilic TaxID=3058392 RepID=UPI00271554DE|nr:flagellar hook capping FlgD N-terminal domain-containing protein [Sulfurimonas sp. hsl 1-7]
MAINAYGENVATYGTVGDTTAAVADKTALGKDDFMKLLLIQLQYQDPTEPMDTEKILTQTSQLAALEASDNTKTALENLTNSLGSAQQFSTIAAIGKRADLGSDAIAYDEGSTSTFELYFPEDAYTGTIEITDGNGDVVATMNIQDQKDADGNPIDTHTEGVWQFTWDGNDDNGNAVTSGIYHVNASYQNEANQTNTTRVGAYPIESVRFDSGTTYVKLGSSYVPLDNVVEVY